MAVLLFHIPVIECLEEKYIFLYLQKEGDEYREDTRKSENFRVRYVMYWISSLNATCVMITTCLCTSSITDVRNRQEEDSQWKWGVQWRVLFVFINPNSQEYDLRSSKSPFTFILTSPLWRVVVVISWYWSAFARQIIA